MDIVRLRTMAEKSTFDFGRYEGVSVGQVLGLDKSYIAYVYYHYANISFLPEILEQVGITEDLRLNKPAKDVELMKKYNRRMYGKRLSAVKEYLAENNIVDTSQKNLVDYVARKVVDKRKRNDIFHANFERDNSVTKTIIRRKTNKKSYLRDKNRKFVN